MKIAHIINPVKVSKERDLYYQQPITFESMRRAKKYSKKKKIDLFAVFYPEDEEIIPGWFTKLPCLQESTLDWGFKVRRKLPLFKEILDSLYDASDADYFIQTNADIGLQPFFYDLVFSLIKKGHESIIINKRIIPPFYKSVEDLDEMYSEIGQPHNGYDCFIFPRKNYPDFELGEICMGINWSEAPITVSMAKKGNLAVLRNAHVTFHIGDQRTWLKPELADYRQHNAEEFAKVAVNLPPDILKDSVIRWMSFKMKYELKPEWSQDCHKLMELTTGLR